jgi:Bacterial transcriptional activator domain
VVRPHQRNDRDCRQRAGLFCEGVRRYCDPARRDRSVRREAASAACGHRCCDDPSSRWCSGTRPRLRRAGWSPSAQLSSCLPLTPWTSGSGPGAPARIISGRRGRGSRTVLEKAPSGIRRKVPARADGHPRPYDGRVEAAADSLSDALALCRGSAYAGFESAPFANAEARRLEELRLGAG